MNGKTNIESRIAEYKRLCGLGMTRQEIANDMNVTVRQTYEYKRLSGIGAKLTHDYQDNLKKYKELCLLGKNASEIANDISLLSKQALHISWICVAQCCISQDHSQFQYSTYSI